MKQTQASTIIPPDNDGLFASTAPNKSDVNTEPVKPLFARKTLAELGSNLPYGIVAGNKLVKPFRLRPFRLKEEKEVSRMKEDAKGLTIGRFVVGVLATMVATVGPHNLEDMSPDKRALILSTMSVADMLYMYLYLRYEALGPDEPVAMKVTCPNCHTDYIWYGDLGSLEVSCVEEDKIDLSREVKLRHGLEYKGINRMSVTIAPLLWQVFMTPGFDARGRREALVLMHSIVGIPGVDMKPFRLTEDQLDNITKYDMSTLHNEIDLNSPGPHLRVMPKCSACNYQTAMMLDWSYDSFFSHSAQQRRMT